MKKDLRSIAISLNKNTGIVNTAMCSCPAGLSGYYYHIMASILEIVDYSLNQLENVPEGIACPSKLRQWGIPGQSNFKEPAMNCNIQKIRNDIMHLV